MSRIPSLPFSQVPTTTPFSSRPSVSHNSEPHSSISPLPSFINRLLPTTHLAVPPQKPRHPTLTASIASSEFHPSLEASLHILNGDLPPAHFLVRHMQAAPAVEGMLLHGILHRCEGDFENARVWMEDAGDICEGWVPKERGKKRLEEVVWERTRLEGEEKGLLGFVYGEGKGEEARRLVDDVEAFRKEGGEMGGGNGMGEKEIEERIRKEFKRVVEWCTKKFGEERWEDASSVWVRPGEEVRNMGNDMVSGDKGWRKF